MDRTACCAHDLSLLRCRVVKEKFVYVSGWRALCRPTVEPNSALNVSDMSWQPMKYNTRKQRLTGLKPTDSWNLLTALSLT